MRSTAPGASVPTTKIAWAAPFRRSKLKYRPSGEKRGLASF